MQEDKLRDQKFHHRISSLCEDEKIIKALVERYIEFTFHYERSEQISLRMQAILELLNVGNISIIERRIDEFVVYRNGEKWLSYDMQRGDWHRENGSN